MQPSWYLSHFAACLLAGKVFYHVISTKASTTSDLKHRQQLEQGMRLTLANLAHRLTESLSQKTPEQVLQLKCKVCAAKQRRPQRTQQDLCQSLGLQCAPVQSSPNEPAVTWPNQSSNSSLWSDDVLWFLQECCLFHTKWDSPQSPAYNGQLLEQVAAELFGANFKIRGPAD